MASSFDFILNGERRTVRDVAPTTTLLEYLRSEGLTGTKEGCGEGDCGACTVVVVDVDGLGRRTYRSVHSCITLLPMFAGREVVTIEGIGTREAPHPVQSAMVRAYGSQCGFCTPGVIASMFEGYYRGDIPLGATTEEERARVRTELADQLSGNLCRCTGYRPIRDALLSAHGERRAREERGLGPDRFEQRLREADTALGALDYAAHGERFVRPANLPDLLALRAEHPEAVLVAGSSRQVQQVRRSHEALTVCGVVRCPERRVGLAQPLLEAVGAEAALLAGAPFAVRLAASRMGR